MLHSLCTDLQACSNIKVQQVGVPTCHPRISGAFEPEDACLERLHR